MIYLSSPIKRSTMIYLTTGFSHNIRAADSRTTGLGFMLTPAHGNRLGVLKAGIPWAADNGCYAQGDKFRLEAFLQWLSLMQQAQSTCLFAVAPDVVGDARATWSRSEPVLPVLRQMGYRAALVAQDGFEDSDSDWDGFDCLFMGGTTKYKLSEAAYEVAAYAKRQGKWLHMGRVNSRKRLLAASVSGHQSADGTTLAFKPNARLKQLTAWLAELERQPSLPGIAA